MSLILNFRHLQAADEPILLQDELYVDERLSSRSDIKATEPFRVKLKAQLSAGIATVTGDLQGEVQMICSLCLTEYSEKMHLAVDQVFTRNEEIAASDRQQRIHFIKGDKVNLKDYVEEDILLAIPYVLRCKPECKGLCTTCGKNLNEGSCHCDTQTIDPRLEKLKHFLQSE